ncbi:recombination regulator RecX [Bacillus sp. PK3_68]|uniref:recombination regulator RecX n=1 Tax=Bacillus sp. PK3_68 TaxID=2027408 RepID=UPI000E736A98|nr:recombination regulator RecX [Bacillus sp. PK3_68]RJS61599.1 recombination regulator RecX [Bacillus sp. PK3_68]
MKVITKISLQQKLTDRYNIFINEEYAFSVDESVLIQYGLKKGMELTDEQIDGIIRRDAVRKGLNMAIQFLSIRMRAEKEVREFLIKKEVESESIEEIIHALYRMNYLDDAEFAKAYTNTQINASDKGPKVIERELKEKGIEGSLIEEALAKFEEGLQLEKSIKLAQKYRQKYRKESPIIQKQKIEQTLSRKGYEWGIIQEAVAGSEEEGNEEEHLEVLMYQAAKAHRRYNKFSGGEYRQKMKQALYRKGFSMSDIEQAIEKLQEE